MLPDSTVRWIAARGRIEFDQNGKPRQLRAISIDITERRRAEDEARDLNGRLITAHEDERARLARALHDDVTQRLALLAIDAGRKEKGLGDTVAGQAMRSIRHDLVQLSEDVHALSYALHPAILEDLGLIEALKAECARFGAVEGIPTSFRAPATSTSRPGPCPFVCTGSRKRRFATSPAIQAPARSKSSFARSAANSSLPSRTMALVSIQPENKLGQASGSLG